MTGAIHQPGGHDARPQPERNQRMHNLHLILINADSATDAASEVEHLILDWGNENNWRRVGGVASEDGSDDIENHHDGRWGLSFLDRDESIPREGTYFSRAVAYLHREIAEPLAGLRPALDQFTDDLRGFAPDGEEPWRLGEIGRELERLSEHLCSHRARQNGTDFPEFFEWQLDRFGLTDFTWQTDGAKRYLLLLDMHS
jgi:hypothetical protein